MINGLPNPYSEDEEILKLEELSKCKRIIDFAMKSDMSKQEILLQIPNYNYYKEKYDELKEDIVMHSAGIALAYAAYLSSKGLKNFEEALYEGLSGIIAGVDKCLEVEEYSELSTYINVQIQFLLENYIFDYEENEAMEFIELSSMPLEDNDEPSYDFDDCFEFSDDRIYIDKLLTVLNPRNKEIMIQYFGLDDKELSIPEIALHFGLNEAAVSYIIESSLDKMRRFGLRQNDYVLKKKLS